MAQWKLLTITMVLIALVFVPVVFGGVEDKCKERLTPGKVCTLMTPPINCDTYEIYRLTDGALVYNGSMTLLNNSIYKFEFNQSEGSYVILLCDNSTATEIIVEGEDEMASLSITFFMLLITGALFFIPFMMRFAQHDLLNKVLRRLCWLMGLFLLGLDAAMVATIAEQAGINLTSELFRVMWIINWTTYVYIVFIMVTLFFDCVALWKLKQYKKRMGEE